MGLFSKNHTVEIACDEHGGHSITTWTKNGAEGIADQVANAAGVTEVKVDGQTVYSQQQD